VFGGDISGKMIVPIVRESPGHYVTTSYEETLRLDSEAELSNFRNRLRASGRYDVVVTPDEKRHYDADPQAVAALFKTVVRHRLEEWLELAEERLAKLNVPAYVMLGNDDYSELAALLTGWDHIQGVEDKLAVLPGGYEMISYGYSNCTPWNSPREASEEQIAAHIEVMAAQLTDPAWALFNLHVPPHNTHLDQAALLNENFTPRVRGGQVEIGPVGSTAVREAIMKYQPLLGLHGHIHEAPAGQKLGRSQVINAGSEYGDGVLKAALVNLDRKKGVRSWQIIHG
jgi:Icc-related predicted phosphoesterase